MRAVRFHEHGEPEVLQVDDVDDPTPEADEVLVSVRAAGVNPVDTYFRSGAYEPFTLPMIPGVDVAGEVAAVGDDVAGGGDADDGDADDEADGNGDAFSPGDRVLATGLGKDHYGTYAELVAVPADRVAHLPDGAGMVEAGAAGVAAVTAWRALIDHADLGPTEHCLVHGGSGGVGHAAVQIAAAAGAEVITTAAPAYHDDVRDLGADVVLDYDRDDLADAVRDAADGGVDVVLDHRLDDYVEFDADVAAVGARIVGIGENDPECGFERMSAVRGKDLQYTFTSTFNTPDLADRLDRVARLVGSGDLEIAVDRTYPLQAAAEAQTAVVEESFLGKLAITP